MRITFADCACRFSVFHNCGVVQNTNRNSRYALPTMKAKLVYFIFCSTVFFSISNAGQTYNSYSTPSDEINFSDSNIHKPNKSKTQHLTGVVYSRVPRTVPSEVTADQFSRERTTIDGKTYKNFDHYDQLSETGDVSHSMQMFNGPGQLVYRDSNGNTQILFDCMNAPIPCVPLDAMVDFTGRYIIFSVYYGELDYMHEHGVDLPNLELRTTHAQMHIVDLQTLKVTPIPQPEGVYDTGPVWLPNGRIMFTSTRSKEFGTSIRDHTPIDTHSLQLWIADVDGKNAANIGPHERDQALHPYVLSSGRVIYSTWQLNHQLPFRENNGGANSFGTTRNFFWVASVDLRGGDFHSLLGAHGTYINNDGEQGMQAAHFLGERANGDICTTNYYRGNNLGSGSVICWTPEPLGVEGRGPAEVVRTQHDEGRRLVFSPRNLYSAFTFATARDDTSWQDRRTGEFLGKVRDPDGLPDGNLLVAYGRGRCSHANAAIFDVQEDKVSCDFGIYATNASKPMKSGVLAEHPSELVEIINEPAWHEYMPRVVATYKDIYGMERPAEPALSNSGDDSECLLASKSMQMHGVSGGVKPHLSEIESFDGWHFGNLGICGQQGCSMHGVDPIKEIKRIRFWRVHPTKLPEGQLPDFNQVQSIMGSRAVILGDVPLEKDGSFMVQLPCDTPYVMAGVDANGRAIARDQVVQSIRPGEKRICQGCHLHSKILKLDFEDTIAASKPPTILDINKAREVEYNRDIQKIFTANCMPCHSSENKQGNLALDISGMDEGSTYHTLVWNHEPDMQRPETSRYVNGSFARESLLYWKAAGMRTDGRKDSDYRDDIDFGPVHPKVISSKDLTILGDWLDSGAYYH